MEPDSSDQDARLDPRISPLLHEYFERRQAGEDLTPERFAREHPELADELRPYLGGLAIVDEARSEAVDTGPAASSLASAELPAIGGFELIEEIGHGGMGVVYKALQVSTKRTVALKVMLAGPFASASARRRFEREVELAARLRHPHIVSVLEGGHIADRPYYAMDYVAGVDVRRYLAVAQPDLRTTLGLFERVCEAVDYAHRQGVIHRDLKPANVLVDDEGEPHVLDFGLAKAADQTEAEEGAAPRVSGPGLVLGTLCYLSPEQAVGAPDEIDLRTDVYALGVMLFEALTGSLPFDRRGSPSAVIQRVLETPPTPPSSLSKTVDGELEAIILKALEKDKARRYQSAGEMAEDIRRYLEGEPISAVQASGLYVFRKKLRKRRRLAAGVGVAVLAAVAVALVTLWHEARSRQREWTQARHEALELQRALEIGVDPVNVRGRAETFQNQHPELCEALLIFAHADYRMAQPLYGAIQLLVTALRQDPSLWPCHALLAEMYHEAGDAEQAEAHRAQAERDAPDTAEARYLRSYATLDQQHALRCAEEAVRRDQSHVLAWARLAYLCDQNDDADGALQAADRLIELGQAVSLWTPFKGRILVTQGRFREAVAEFTRLPVPAFRPRAHAYRRLKEYDKAVADYTWLIENQGAPWDHYQRATPLWILGRTDEALADYRRVRVLLGRPGYYDARQYLILRELGRDEEAEEVLTAALRDVENPSWLRQILRSLAGELRPDELVADGRGRNNLEQLCEAYYYAGEVSLLGGDRDAARNWFEQCVQTGLDFDPDSSAPDTPMNEYELAQWRLESLFGSTQPTSRP